MTLFKSAEPIRPSSSISYILKAVYAFTCGVAYPFNLENYISCQTYVFSYIGTETGQKVEKIIKGYLAVNFIRTKHLVNSLSEGIKPEHGKINEFMLGETFFPLQETAKNLVYSMKYILVRDIEYKFNRVTYCKISFLVKKVHFSYSSSCSLVKALLRLPMMQKTKKSCEERTIII